MTVVLHVVKASGIAGAERHLLALLPGQTSNGLRARLLVIGVPGAETFVRAMGNKDVDVATVPAGPDLNPRLVWRLHREILRIRPDLVHSHLIHADVHGQVAARLAGVPGVSTVHGAHRFYRRQPIRSVARLAGHLASKTIAVSHHVAEMLTGAGVVRRADVRVVHYGLDPKEWESNDGERERARKAFGLAPDQVAIGIAARLIPGKGHDRLVRAVATASGQHGGIRLLIAGHGPTRTAITGLAESLGIRGIVGDLGFVEDVRRFMAACDVIAFPTQPALGEGFGLAALEAMAAGRAVVATRIASLPEIVLHEETGLLVPPDSVPALAEALSRLASDVKLRERLGAAGQRRAAEQFSLVQMLDKTAAVYNEVREAAG